MKKGVIVLFLLVILLVSPLALAQDQTYAGFNRFTDDVRLFFSSGDNKVKLAVNIKEKEINSALENIQNGNTEKGNENLERAWKKLKLVQEKVSVNTAEEVKESSNEIRTNIMNQENLPNDFEVYALEEEKTELTAEWVIEIDGKEGQTLSNEVKNVIDEGQNVIDGEQNRVVEIENRIDEINNEISNWVVENDIADGDNGLVPFVKMDVAGENTVENKNIVGVEIKTYSPGDGTDDNNLPEPDLSEKHYDPSKDEIITNNIDEGEVTNNIDGGVGTEGTNEIAPAVDSNEGDDSVDNSGDSGGDSVDSASITGEVVKDSDNIINKIFSWFF